jgi:hypothetical protein
MMLATVGSTSPFVCHARPAAASAFFGWLLLSERKGKELGEI